MKTGVKIIREKFHVNTNAKVVVCEILCDLQTERHPAYFHLGSLRFEKEVMRVGRNGRFRVKGIARCSNLDTFDKEKGEKIAKSRAKTKMYHIAEKVWWYYGEELNKAANQCYNTCSRCFTAKEAEKNHVKELIV